MTNFYAHNIRHDKGLRRASQLGPICEVLADRLACLTNSHRLYGLSVMPKPADN